MNDQEIRMWAVQMVGVEHRHLPTAIEEAEMLYQFVTGKVLPVMESPFKVNEKGAV